MSSKVIHLLSIADTAEQHQIGLKNIKFLPADFGMLFVFPRPQIIGLWMLDTYIPLDVLFIDANGIVTQLEVMQPHNTRSTYSTKECLMALEVAAGTFDQSVVGQKMMVRADNDSVLVMID